MQNRTYSAREDRALIASLFTEGVLGAGFAVTQRAAGTNMSVDIAPGTAVVTGDDQPDQGRYLVTSTAVENRTIGAPPGSNSRIDAVILQVRDPNAGGATGDDAILTVVAGTAAASPSPPTIPASAIVLAYVTVAAGTVAITNAMIADQRVASGSAYDLIVPGSILTADLADLAVQTAKLNDLAVTTAKLANLAVTSAKIAAGAVTNDKIGVPSWGQLTGTAGRTVIYSRTGYLVNVRTGPSGWDDSEAGTIPSGFRPHTVVSAPVVDVTGQFVGEVVISTGGAITYDFGGTVFETGVFNLCYLVAGV